MKEKRTEADLNPVRMLLGGYLECDGRVEIREKSKIKERRKRKKKVRQSFVFSGNKR